MELATHCHSDASKFEAASRFLNRWFTPKLHCECLTVVTAFGATSCGVARLYMCRYSTLLVYSFLMLCNIVILILRLVLKA